MGMSFSNAAVKFDNIDQLKEVACAQPPIKEDGIDFSFPCFYLFRPINGWTSILAPGDHPANSYALAAAIARKFDVLGFAGFVSQSSRIGARFFKGDSMIYQFRNGDKFQQDGSLTKLQEVFSPTCPDNFSFLEELFRNQRTFAEESYRSVIDSFSLPPLLAEWGFEYVEKAEENSELEERFKDIMPEKVFMKGYDN